jgi:hypothetical protein
LKRAPSVRSIQNGYPETSASLKATRSQPRAAASLTNDAIFSSVVVRSSQTGAICATPTVRTSSFIAELDHRVVREERHNFHLAGHYSRPDVTRLVVNRARQSTATFVGGTEPLPVLADLDVPVDMPG